MHQPFSCTLAFALLFASSTAAPTDNQQYSKVDRLPTGNQKNQNGILHIEKTYRKYGWQMPEKLAATAETIRQKSVVTSTVTTGVSQQKIAQQQNQGTVGSVSAIPGPDNAEYLCPITIGGQQLQLDIDTGSSDFWVFSTALPNDERTNHTLYDPTKSPTVGDAGGLTFDLTYGDGQNIQGKVVKDTVQLGGLYVKNQAVELPDKLTPGLVQDNSQGILGLAFQPLNSIKQGNTAAPQPTWFENVMSQLVNPLFTVNLKAGMSGYYKFGEIDHTAYKDGTLWYTPVDNSSSTWGFESSQYAIGSGETQQNLNNNSRAILDTGTSILFVNPAPFNAFYAQVNGKSYNKTTGMTIYPCSETLPDFHVSVGSQMITVPGHLLNFMQDDGAGPNGETMCVGGIQTNNHNDGPQVYGDILFELYFTIFDYGNMRLGLAPHA